MVGGPGVPAGTDPNMLGTWTKSAVKFNSRPVYQKGLQYMYVSLYYGNYFWVTSATMVDGNEFDAVGFCYNSYLDKPFGVNNWIDFWFGADIYSLYEGSC